VSFLVLLKEPLSASNERLSKCMSFPFLLLSLIVEQEQISTAKLKISRMLFLFIVLILSLQSNFRLELALRAASEMPSRNYVVGTSLFLLRNSYAVMGTSF
jgi:hypothetical protein